MPLQLRYVFTPSPNPIRASAGGSNPNLVTLQMMVSNPRPDPAMVTEIAITIPVGQEGARTLSDSPSLPAPEYDTSSGWSASSSGSVVTLTLPPQGLLDSFVFTLPGIQINDTPGVVPLTITELAPPAPKVIDSTTYALVKYEADFPVTNFYAEPATLYNLNETATLRWQCSDQGARYLYSVHSDSWQPDDCLDGGQCFTCADGRGVESPPLDEGTTFALDIIRTNPDGSRTVYQTLDTRVRVLLPSISSASYLESLFAGTIVRLHWLAYNAAYCAVELDGRVIDGRAPTDTYEQGYQVFLAAQEDPHQLVVIAHAESGPAQSSFIFPNVYTASSTISVGGTPNSVTVTPNGQRALVAGWGEGLLPGIVTAVNLNTLTVEGPAVSVGPLPSSIAVTPDGSLALVPSYTGGTVTVIDLATMAAEANQLQLAGGGLADIAVTPDGRLALVASFDADNVAVVDIAARKVEAQRIGVGTSPAALAVTPDGARALVVNQNSAELSVIDIAGRGGGGPRHRGDRPIDIAVTPDGRLALVAGHGGVTVVDLDTLKAEPAVIRVGDNPVAVAVTPDGALALVSDGDDNDVWVINVPARAAVGRPLPAGQQPNGIAITPDGQMMMTANVRSKDLTVM